MERWWNPRGTLPQGRPGPPRSLSGLRPHSFQLLGKNMRSEGRCAASCCWDVKVLIPKSDSQAGDGMKTRAMISGLKLVSLTSFLGRPLIRHGRAFCRPWMFCSTSCRAKLTACEAIDLRKATGRGKRCGFRKSSRAGSKSRGSPKWVASFGKWGPWTKPCGPFPGLVLTHNYFLAQFSPIPNWRLTRQRAAISRGPRTSEVRLVRLQERLGSKGTSPERVPIG